MNPLINILKHNIQPLVLPLVLLLVAWFVSPYQDAVPLSFAGLWDYGPYLMLVVFAGFGIFYNRGRALLVALLLVSGLVLVDNSNSSLLSKITEPKLVNFILVGLIPLNMAFIGFYKERGLFTYSGGIRFGVIPLQFLLLIGVYFIGPEFTIRSIDAIHFSFLESDPKSPLLHAHLSYVLMVASGVALFVVASLQKTNLSFGLFAAFCGYSMGMLITERQELFHINMVAVSLVLWVAILRDSYNMAYLDDLTGLPQRRALNEQFMSLGNQYTLAMVDIDHFKKFNDTHGHDVGDEVLRLVAAQIGRVRDGGKAYRYGGEEFSVIYPSKVKEQAMRSLEEVRESIESYEIIIRAPRRDNKPKKTKEGQKKDRALEAKRGKGPSFDAKKVSVTVSIGVADKVDKYETPEEVLKKADKALYQAKDGGRNQVVMWEEKKKK